MSDDVPTPTNLVEKLGDNCLVEATGTNNLDLQLSLTDQLIETLWLPKGLSEEEIDKRLRAGIAALMEIRPRGAAEGALAVQMVATHNAALGCLKQALEAPQTPYRFELMKQAERLMALYLRQYDTLYKYRGVGMPTVNVENVNVQAGGQAIVGHVQAERKPDRPEAEMYPPGKTIDQHSVETLDLTPTDPVYADARIGRRGPS
jgi:hypothetical protein